MRLVCREFDNKICQALFRVVVVPFRPEIYGIASETENALMQSSVMLQDQGMRVFQGFGRWIKRFAMSFEIDIAKLSSPPVKSDQEAITSFWGIYRWPFKNYNRYTQLEGLEQTADETRSMAKALRYITDAQELGISIDGGLGWLSGPDINSRVVDRASKLRVFGESKFVPESRPRLRLGRPNPASGMVLDARPHVYTAFERMLQEAGYRGENLESSMRLMLESEEQGVQQNGAPSPWESFQQSPAQLLESANWRRRRPRTHENTPTTGPATDVANGHTLVDDFASDEDDDAVLPVALPTISLSSKTSKPKEVCSLKPNDLTTAQKEMLLEMEWAQNAFMQSWVIAIVDNRSTFRNIKTLNIARLPKRHLPILSRKDFWNSLPGLDKLSLAIIPDWRDIKKDETTWVQDQRVSPSSSVPIVFQILQEHISPRKNITTLHFEWLCGGEYAPGLFARNQHILAAPVVAQSMHMVNRAQHHAVLNLPYVEHLSFKNCWFSPHILTRFLWPLKKDTIESVTFDSVSLTAAIPLHAQPNPLAQAGIAHNAQNMPGGPVAAAANAVNVAGIGFPPVLPNMQQAQQPPAANQNAEPDWLQLPRNGSWVEIIDHLTPGRTLADIRYDRNTAPEPAARAPGRLSKLQFKSCGYIRLPMDFDQSALEGVAMHNNVQHANITKRINDIDAHMMKALDHHLGTINNHIPAVEAAALDHAWAFNIGWRDTRPDLTADAILDGIHNPGAGRFDGLIDPPARISSSSRH